MCVEFERLGPDVPTLCGGWTSWDLLAHLLVRERKPWAAAGILVPPLAGVTDAAMRGYRSTAWPEMVGLLRGGAPLWSPFHLSAVDGVANLMEFFVHHEDLRRGSPGWRPRAPDPARDAQLWTMIGRAGRLLHRRSPVGVTLRNSGGAEHQVRRGRGGVTIVGAPGEIVLHAFGRDAVELEIEGAAADVAALSAAPRGV